MSDPTKIVSNSALPDTRPQVAKDKDYRSSEIIAAAIAPFQHTKVTTITGATVYDQWYVGDCVPHGFYTMLEYEGIVPRSGMSQLRVYRKRSNYPQAGSIAVDLLDKIRAGQSPQVEFPTPANFTEDQATAMPLVVGSKLIKDFNYFQHLDSKGKQDFTLIAGDVAAGKAVAVFIYATEEEWSKDTVDIINPNLALADAYVRHCVCLIPSGDFTENGVQRFSVHDSAAFGGLHLRHVSLDFILKRSYFSVKSYAVGTVPPPPAVIVLGKPVNACQLNDSGNSVKVLQKFLIDAGEMDAKYLTGFYGPITAKAVLSWQIKNVKTVTAYQLIAWAGHYWGPASIAVAK